MSVSSEGPLGQVQRLSLTLFPRFADPTWSVQRIVGIIGGGGTIVIGVVNSLNYGFADGQSFFAGLVSAYTGLILIMGIISISCGFWDHPIARSVHIVLFIFSGIFGAVSANRGNITSAFFLVFAFVLLVEYGVNRKLMWVFTIMMLGGYVAALSVGYADDVARPVISAFASLVMVLVFVVLFGGVTLRHRLRLQLDAVELESRIEQRTAELNSALSERNVMLREIHHRVKNNLQTVSTVLGMEMDSVAPDARRALEASRQRIHAMAGVHDALYRSDRLDRVDLSLYVRELLDTAVQTAVAPIDLSLEVAVEQPVDLSFAVSLGLALHELVSNTIKHAFDKQEDRRLRVEIAQRERQIEVCVEDNGKGLPQGFDPETDGRVGMSVVTSIVRHRGGTLDIGGDGGTRWTVVLPLGRESG